MKRREFLGASLATGLWRTIVLEDVHWADTSSVEVLQLVVDRLIGCPVAMLSTSPERDDTILMRDPFEK